MVAFQCGFCKNITNFDRYETFIKDDRKFCRPICSECWPKHKDKPNAIDDKPWSG